MSRSAPAATGPEIDIDLAGVERVIRAWSSQLDPALLTGADAAKAVERLATSIRLLAAAQASLAHRADECHAQPATCRSAAEWLARQNGSSRTEAQRTLDTASRLRSLPTTAAAVASGELSLAEADVVSGAATVDPSAEQRLVDKARAHDLFETRAAADRVKQAARSFEEEAAREARLRRARMWRTRRSSEGLIEVRAAFVPADYARAKPAIDAQLKARLERARLAGERDTYENYAADAVLAALRAASGGGQPSTTSATTREADPTYETDTTTPRTSARTATAASGSPLTTGAAGDDSRAILPLELGPDPAPPPGPEPPDPKIDWSVVVLVDGIALKRGWAAPGETCEIPGIGPVAVAWIETLLPQAQVEMLIHDSVDIRAYATSTRHRPRPVQLAVQVRDRDCNRPGCHHDIAELDHTEDFARTHHTCTHSLGGLCHHDHDQKTHRGAHLERHDPDWHWWPGGADPATDPPQTKPIGRHLTTWNLDHLPPHDHDHDHDARPEP